MAKSLLGVAMGFAAGLLAGWFFFARTETARPRGIVRTIYVPSDPGDETQPDEPDYDPTEAPPLTGSAGVITPADLVDLDSTELMRLIRADATLSPEAVERISLLLDEARQQRDWNRFRSLLSLLGKANSPEAHAKLVAVMGDPELGFHRTQLGRQFFRWLQGSDTAGIVAAARVRLDREIEENPGSAAVQRGWLALIAQHGDANDLAWIESKATDKGGEREVLEAFIAASARPEVAARVADLFQNREKRWFSGHLRVFALNNPDAAQPLIEEGLRAPKKGEGRDLARVYGETVTADNLEHARTFLNGLNEPEQRIAAVYAVEKMKRKGLDVSGMENLTLGPVVALEQIGTGGSSADLYQLRYVIERNPVTWSERAAKALEAAAATAPKSQIAALQAAAKKVRAGIGSSESEWVTK